MPMYWVSIEVHLGSPLSLVNEDGSGERARLRGFVQELGCTAGDEETLRARVRAHVDSYKLGPAQTTEVVFQEIERLELDDLDVEIRTHFSSDPRATGIWYETGRSFYSEDEGA